MTTTIYIVYIHLYKRIELYKKMLKLFTHPIKHLN